MLYNYNSDKSQELAVLWQQVVQGDTASFNLIHTCLFEGLFYYARKWLEDDSLASDAIQELFIKLWEKRHRIGMVANVQTYFFTALRRQLLNQVRAGKQLARLAAPAGPMIEFSPEEIIIQTEESRHLHAKLTALLNSLPPRQREIIYLHFFEKIEYREIAAIMKINYQSVLNLMHKALENLRKNPDLLFSFLMLLGTFTAV
ncbi:RNA polymerase sigma factor [Parafilimonas sp.]|uniref:RNA polymerase sigma factor n=1 Tax=Parafilimonas sp. TaxID=1969739 RepID=UPI0039E3EE41